MLMRGTFLAASQSEPHLKSKEKKVKAGWDKRAIFINILILREQRVANEVWLQPDSYKSCELYISL